MCLSSRKLFATCGAILLVAARASAFKYDVVVANAPAGADNIELIFINTGGEVGNRVGISPPIQGGLGGSPPNGVSAQFAPTAAGDTYEATFTCPQPDVAFSSGNWTQGDKNFKAIGGGDVTLSKVQGAPGPAASASFLLAAALRRRRRR